MTSDIRLADLCARHGGTAGLVFREGPAGLFFADVTNRHAHACVCLQGAQVLHWQPHDQAHPVLWLSAGARLAPGKAIRGGIPICWPWFGPAAPGSAQPQAAGSAHGFARTQAWSFNGAQALADGATRLCLRLTDTVQTREAWPAAFDLELRVTIGASLGLELTSRNTGSAVIMITEALHTYFRIGDIDAIAVHGLAGESYFDAVAATAAAPAASAEPAEQEGAVRFPGEVDRVYDARGGCHIDDPLLGRQLHIAKSGSASTIVWNPWNAKAERLGDIEPGGWRQMVCVESGNARANTVRLAPGASHCLSVRYHVKPLRTGAA